MVCVFLANSSIFIQITTKGICSINKEILGTTLKPSSLSGAFASIDYYPTKELKISSVVRAIIKNHYFPDGNKRTATLVYAVLCDLNKLKSKPNIGSIIEDIAINQYSVEQVAEKLF